MPAKNSLKEYLENGYYHIYNRGVEKRKIFLDEQDYGVFLSYLKEYLNPKDEIILRNVLSNLNSSYLEKENATKLLRMNNYHDEINLLCYCLMPNHFHFLIKQHNAGSMDSFVCSLCTRYTMYFNKKYKRVGSLYQGVYKAILIKSDEQLLQLSRYIHYQSIAKQDLASKGETLPSYSIEQPSSLPEYLDLRKTKWVKTEEILKSFSKNKVNPLLTYEDFAKHGGDFEIIYKVAIEEF